jgi:FKBP-type peptidyl-prolyl cis-trans isomerase SlyD
MQVGENTVVSLRYIMRNGRGAIIENTMNSNPTNYLQGSASILSSLQNQIEGLEKGDKKTVQLGLDEPYVDDDFSFEIIIDDVREALPEEIALGYPVKINLERCDENCDCYSSATNVSS